MMVKSENDKLLGRIAELRDELYNARHEKTRSDVNLKLAAERVRENIILNKISIYFDY
jgi:hypothetical protein